MFSLIYGIYFVRTLRVDETFSTGRVFGANAPIQRMSNKLIRQTTNKPGAVADNPVSAPAVGRVPSKPIPEELKFKENLVSALKTALNQNKRALLNSQHGMEHGEWMRRKNQRGGGPEMEGEDNENIHAWELIIYINDRMDKGENFAVEDIDGLIQSFEKNHRSIPTGDDAKKSPPKRKVPELAVAVPEQKDKSAPKDNDPVNSTDAIKTSKQPHLTDAKMVVLVLSRRDGYERRMTIRETWAADHSNVYFVVGGLDCAVPYERRAGDPEQPPWIKSPFCSDSHGRALASDMYMAGVPSMTEAEILDWEEMISINDKNAAQLKNEMETFGDIIVATDVIEIYRSLPAKLKSGYRWAIQNHPDAEWFLKIDDDSYVRVGSLSTYLQEFVNKYADPLLHPAVIGNIKPHNEPFKKGKWKEDSHFKGRYYPKFPTGSWGHIVSRPVAEYVSENSEELYEYQGEDVSLGIWLDESPLKNKVKWIRGNRFMTNKEDCTIAWKVIIGHNFNDQDLKYCFDQMDEVHERIDPPVQFFKDRENDRGLGDRRHRQKNRRDWKNVKGSDDRRYRQKNRRDEIKRKMRKKKENKEGKTSSWTKMISKYLG